MTCRICSTALLLLCVSTALLAEAPECRRLQTDVAFNRVEMLPASEVESFTAVGPNGSDGLLLVRAAEDAADEIEVQRWIAGDDGPQLAGTRPLSLSFSVPTALAGRFDDDALYDSVILEGGRFRPTAIRFNHYRAGETPGSLQPVIQGDYSRFGFFNNEPVVGDFDDDGIDEIAMPLCFERRICQFNSALDLVKADDSGVFEFVLSRRVNGLSLFYGTVVVDWNRDGIDDVVILGSQGGDGLILPFLGDPDEPLQPQPVVLTNFQVIQGLALNGRLLVRELVDPRFWTTRLHQVAPGASGSVELEWSLDLPDWSSNFEPPLDLDGDGQADLFHGNHIAWFFFPFGEYGARVYWGSPSGAPEPGPDSASYSTFAAVLGPDSRGRRTIVTNDFAMLVQDGESRLDTGTRLTSLVLDSFVDQGGASQAVGDLDGDGLDDVVAAAVFPNILAAGLSNGDGTFRQIDIDAPPIQFFRDSRLLDVDGDGHLDLTNPRRGGSIVWGRGDGTFEQFQRFDLEFRNFYARLTEGPERTVVELTTDDGVTTVRTFRVEERNLVATDFEQTLPPDTFTPSIGDLDGDSIDDLLFVTRLPDGNELRMLPGDGTGGFGAERTILQIGTQFPGQIDVADLDLDGDPDLFMGSPFLGYRAWLSLEDGTYVQSLDTPGATRTDYRTEHRLSDMNGDGIPDLTVTYLSDFFLPYSTALRVRLGDGLGGLGEPLEWAGPAGATGVFRDSGQVDVARAMVRGIFSVGIEVMLSDATVAAADEAAPTVRATLLPQIEAGDLAGRLFRVATTPSDDCDDRPQITGRRIGLPALDLNTPISFTPSTMREVRVLQNLRTGQREVLLRGDDETAMRQALAEAVSAGGFAFEHLAPLELASTGSPGPAGQGSDPQAVEILRFGLDLNGRLVRAVSSAPGQDLEFVLEATDAAGRVGTSRVPFRQAPRAALPAAAVPPDVIGTPRRLAP